MLAEVLTDSSVSDCFFKAGLLQQLDQIREWMETHKVN
jgi:hypothetical protein